MVSWILGVKGSTAGWLEVGWPDNKRNLSMNVCYEGNVLEELLWLLKLEQIEKNIFRGQSQDLGYGNVFGGQVIGQAPRRPDSAWYSRKTALQKTH